MHDENDEQCHRAKPKGDQEKSMRERDHRKGHRTQRKAFLSRRGSAIRSVHLPPGRTALKILQTNGHLAALARKVLQEEVKGR